MNALKHRTRVYACFGRAMYHAQCVDQLIVKLLVFFDYFEKRTAPVDQWQKDFDVFDDVASGNTTRRFISAMNQLRLIDRGMQDLLNLAHQKRNWLATSYFVDRLDDLSSKPGRNKMLEELDEALRLFTEVEELLNPVIKELCDKYELNEAVLEAISYRLSGTFVSDLNKSFRPVPVEDN